METNEQTNKLQKNEAIISKDLREHYVVELYKGRSIYSDWNTLVKDVFVEEPKEQFEPTVLKKGVVISPNEEVCVLFCVGCGKPILYPVDAKEYPAYCEDRCKYKYEGEK